LYVHYAHYLELAGYKRRIFLDIGEVRFADAPRRYHTSRVARMYAGVLYMFHNCRDEDVRPVGYRVDLAFERVLEETVYKHRVFGADFYRLDRVSAQHRLVVYYLHAPAAEHERRPHHQRVSYPVRYEDGLFKRTRDPALRLRNTELYHLLPEELPVLGERYALGARSEYLHAVILKLVRYIQGRLPAELHDDAFRLLLLIYGKDVLYGQRLEIKLVRRIVIGGYGLGVAVHHYRL